MSEFQEVLGRWIEQAGSSTGALPPGATPAAWTASRASEWWEARAGDSLADCDRSVAAIRDELMRTGGGWTVFGEILHELTHLEEALADLRGLMGLGGDT